MASNKKQGILMVVLIVLLILAVVYIGFGKYNTWSQANQVGIAQYGYNQAILTVAEQAATCQQVPLIIGNQTINLIAVECLTAPAASAPPASTEEAQ